MNLYNEKIQETVNILNESERKYISERLLHFVWKYSLYENKILKTDDEKHISVIKKGDHNTNSGPDFLNAVIEIENIKLAGSIEIHIFSSDWKRHKHDEDAAYNNVILHVVYVNDAPAKRSDGSEIPTIELKNIIDKNKTGNYIKLLEAEDWIACEKMFPKLSQPLLYSWLARLFAERMERKTKEIFQLLDEENGSWENVFYITLAANFGFSVNRKPFETLAKKIPLHILARHKNNLFQLESLLFGVAGMLNEKNNTDYFLKLKKEFSHLKIKFNLDEMNASEWKFLRTRPANFPTVRIAQFASLVYNSSHLFSKIISEKKIKDIMKFFNCETSAYWKTHYKFGEEFHSKKINFGKDAVNNIIINSVAPLLFTYGKYIAEEDYCERAISILEIIPAEKNSIISNWNKLYLDAANAFETQALIELYKNYCTKKNCLECAFGMKIITG